MTNQLNRRTLLKTSGALALTGALGTPSILRAQTPVVKIGVLEPRAGNLV